MEDKKEFTLRRFSIEFREGYSFREELMRLETTRHKLKELIGI